MKKNTHFRFVYNKGKSFANKNLVVYVLKNKTTQNCIGISISKKVGNSVIRNRIRRLIKESYRTLEINLNNSYDIIIIARVTPNVPTFSEILKSLKYLLKKHELLNII